MPPMDGKIKLVIGAERLRWLRDAAFIRGCSMSQIVRDLIDGAMSKASKLS